MARKASSVGKKVIVQFSSASLGEGVSVSRFVVEALKEVEKSGLKFQLTPTSTVIEANSLQEAMETIMNAHEALFRAGAERVITDIKIDDRRDEPRKMEDKVEKVKKLLAASKQQ